MVYLFIHIFNTHSSKLFQIANAVRRRTSFPSSRIRSHTLSTVSLGRQVENRVRNHCIVKTFVNGGSKLVPKHNFKRWSKPLNTRQENLWRMQCHIVNPQKCQLQSSKLFGSFHWHWMKHNVYFV